MNPIEATKKRLHNLLHHGAAVAAAGGGAGAPAVVAPMGAMLAGATAAGPMPIGAAVDPAAGTAVGATAQAATGAAIAGPPGSDPVLIRLLAINDFHGQLGDSDAVVDGVPIGGAATLAAYMNRERAADPAGTVMVSAGDAFGASPPESSLLDHESTMAVLTQMGLDVATFGNHEWDRGFNETMRLVFGGKRTMTVNGKQVATGPMWPGSPFPWVSANLVDRKTGKPLVPPFLHQDRERREGRLHWPPPRSTSRK